MNLHELNNAICNLIILHFTHNPHSQDTFHVDLVDTKQMSNILDNKHNKVYIIICIGIVISGQFETYLFQKGEPTILEAIKKCWASSFSMRVMQHRLDCNLPISNIAMAVVIQVSVIASDINL